VSERPGLLVVRPGEDPVRSVLVVTAHPDDVDFGMAGTVATWTDAGVRVSYCVVTDGDAGGFDRSVPRREMPRIRRAEQQAAAKEVGVEEVVFLGYPDGRLAPSLELRRDISRVIRQVRPDRVVCQSHERSWSRIFTSHPDHLAAAEATVCAVYPDARNPFAHPELLEEEGLEPHVVRELWLMGTDQPDRVVDVTDQVERKLAALRCHASQHPDVAAMEERVRGWLATTAEAAGLPPGRAAEAFRAVQTG